MIKLYVLIAFGALIFSSCSTTSQGKKEVTEPNPAGACPYSKPEVLDECGCDPHFVAAATALHIVPLSTLEKVGVGKCIEAQLKARVEYTPINGEGGFKACIESVDTIHEATRNELLVTYRSLAKVKEEKIQWFSECEKRVLTRKASGGIAVGTGLHFAKNNQLAVGGRTSIDYDTDYGKPRFLINFTYFERPYDVLQSTLPGIEPYEDIGYSKVPSAGLGFEYVASFVPHIRPFGGCVIDPFTGNWQLPFGVETTFKKVSVALEGRHLQYRMPVESFFFNSYGKGHYVESKELKVENQIGLTLSLSLLPFYTYEN